jgi:hypothetical protein
MTATDRGRIIVAAGSRRRATVGLREAPSCPSSARCDLQRHSDCEVWYQFCKPDVSLMARAPIRDVRELTRPLKHEDDMAKKAKKAKKAAASTKKVAKKTTAKKKK